MSTESAGRRPVTNTQPRLSGADRALMQAVAEREWAQGKISIEEYQYIQDRCRARPGAAILRRVPRLIARGGLARFPTGQPGDPVLCVLRPHAETIPVSSIVGSVDRAVQLDRRFRPRHGSSARLDSIRRAFEAGVIFPPIEVYRLAGACYVIDGHHRVAAALHAGQLYLDAMVSECWPQGAESEAPLEAARVAFGLHTGLYALSLKTAERYSQALQQIHDHRWYLGERGRVVSFPEAAEDWYHMVFLPTLQHMVAAGLAALENPGETGDRYFELCDLKYRVSSERGHDIGFTEAVRLWAVRLPRRPHLALFRRRREASVA